MPSRRPKSVPVPDEAAPGGPEQGWLPFEPDQGRVPAVIPDDPEHDRLVDPEDARRARPSPITLNIEVQP